MKKKLWSIWTGRILSEWKKFNEEFVPPPGTSRAALFLDYTKCIFKYHISYSEYFEQYRFYGLKNCERDEFITRAQAHRIATRLNNKAIDVFWNKDRFLKRFSAFIGREWLSVKESSLEEFHKFTSKHNRFIVKPVNGSFGIGIKVVNSKETDIDQLYEELSKGNYVLEEYLSACKELADFNPDSLNTLRVVTYANDGKFEVVGSFLRMGLKGNHVDNAHHGGLFAKIDINTGIIVTEGTNNPGDRYVLHPSTNKQIVGFQIPVWNEVLEICRRAADSIPEAKIVGWDVAILPDYTVVIIEGNHMPDFDTMQSAARRGIKRELMQILNGA